MPINKFLLFFIILSGLSGCNLESYIKDKSANPVVSISSTKPIFATTTSTLGVFTHNYTAITPTDSSQSPGVGSTVSGAGVGFTTTLAATNSTPLTVSTNLGTVPIDALNENYSISITSSSDLSNWTCQIFSNTLISLCGGSPITFAASLLTGVQAISLKFSSDRGSIQSNEIPVNSFKIRQISNTRNSITLTDGITQSYVFNSKIYFNGTNSTGQANRLFEIDPATEQIRQIFSNFIVNARPFTVGTIAGKMMFWGTSTGGGVKLFSYDGTSIVQVSNSTADQTRNDTFQGDLRQINYNGHLYFACRGASFAINRICRYDGTTLQILSHSFLDHDIDPNDQGLFLFGDKLYFSASNLGNHYLMSYDITGGTYTQLTSVNIGTNGNFQMRGPLLGKYYSNGNTDFGLVETTNFSTFTTIANTNAGGLDQLNFGGSPTDFLVGNKILFNALNSSGVYKCYSFDGTEVRQLFNNLGNATSESCGIVIFSGIAYLTGTNAQGSSKLFKYDGTTLTQISNTTGNEATNDIAVALALIDNKLYFRSYTSAGRNKLFMYDGTNTIQLSNTNSSGDDNPAGIVKIGDFLYFTADITGGYKKYFRLCSTSSPTCTD